MARDWSGGPLSVAANGRQLDSCAQCTRCLLLFKLNCSYSMLSATIVRKLDSDHRPSVGVTQCGTLHAPMHSVVSIGIVRGAFPLAMGVASDRRLMGTIEHHTRYPHRKHACAPWLSCISELHWQRATRMRGPGIMSLGLTDLAGPIGKES